MSNIIDSIKLSGTTYQIQGTGGEGTVSALTETNPTLITSGYYTATTIDTIYIKVKDGVTTTYNITNALGCYTSDDKQLTIRVGTNGSGITSVASSSAYTSTISDGIAKIEFVSPLTLKRVLSSFESFTPYYFPQTPYTSGSTSEVVEGAVYDSLRDLSLEVLDKDSIVTVKQELQGNTLNLNLQTDKHLYYFTTNLASPTINLKGKRLNTQFSSSTVSQSVLNLGTSNYCTVQDSGKTLDDLTLTFNPSYTGGSTSTVFSVYLRPSGGGSSVTLSFTYDISNNSITWNTTGWDTYLSVVDTLSTDYKLKIVANTGYKIISLYNNLCSIAGVDTLNKDYYLVTLVTTTSNVHDGQEVIDDLYANKQDKLSAGTGINITDNVISATGGGGGNPTVELTQAQYDALVTAGTVQADTYYIITDAQAGDLTNYYTKSETNTLLNGKQATLVSGTNIKTINNESLLGSGNIDIQGGSTYTAGRGISIANDTISFNLPISAGTGSNSIVEGNTNNRANGEAAHAEGYSTTAYTYAHAEGNHTKASGWSSHAEGSYTTANGVNSHTEGRYTIANNFSEHASGQYNNSVSASTTFGDSGNTLFSVGNGTADNARHNAFEIRQNGDIYYFDGTNDVKLQDKFSSLDSTIGDINTILESI
jgi:hypothetical protein